MLLLIFFTFGLFIGSFLLVLVERLHRNETVIKGRSHCEKCKHTLFWYDLVPLFSYITLAGRCRYCKKPIGMRYPLVEFITGVMFALTIFLYQISNIKYPISNIQYILELGFYLFLVSSFIVIFFTDLWYGIIPDKILLPTMVITFIYILLTTHYLLPNYVLSALGASLFFLVIVLVTRGRGMGLGDVKFAFFMGLLLGFPRICIALYMAFLTGAVVSLILIAAHKKKFRGDTIAFGPFLIIGTYISFFFGNMIWHRIFGTFLM